LNNKNNKVKTKPFELAGKTRGEPGGTAGRTRMIQGEPGETRGNQGNPGEPGRTREKQEVEPLGTRTVGSMPGPRGNQGEPGGT
jgi:hypothetical protein